MPVLTGLRVCLETQACLVMLAYLERQACCDVGVFGEAACLVMLAYLKRRVELVCWALAGLNQELLLARI